MASLNVTNRLENRFTFTGIRDTRWRKTVAKILTYITILCYLTIVLFPIFWMVSTGVKMNKNVAKMPPEFWPAEPSYEGYQLIFTQEKIIWTFFKNSFIVGFSVVALCIGVGSFAGYALSRFTFPGSKPMMLFILASQMFPTVVMLIPIYLLFVKIGLVDKHFSVILMHTSITLPFCIWILKGFFDTIPVDMEEAAHIDGCGRFGILWRIVFPLIGPGVVAAGIYAFLLSWNEYIFASILTSEIEMRTLPTGLYITYLGQYEHRWSDVMVASLAFTMPIIVIYVFFQKYVVGGLLGGAIKG
jgi:multiple sugar transport system permease protein